MRLPSYEGNKSKWNCTILMFHVKQLMRTSILLSFFGGLGGRIEYRHTCGKRNLLSLITFLY